MAGALLPFLADHLGLLVRTLALWIVLGMAGGVWLGLCGARLERKAEARRRNAVAIEIAETPQGPAALIREVSAQ